MLKALFNGEIDHIGDDYDDKEAQIFYRLSIGGDYFEYQKLIDEWLYDANTDCMLFSLCIKYNCTFYQDTGVDMILHKRPDYLTIEAFKVIVDLAEDLKNVVNWNNQLIWGPAWCSPEERAEFSESGILHRAFLKTYDYQSYLELNGDFIINYKFWFKKPININERMEITSNKSKDINQLRLNGTFPYKYLNLCKNETKIPKYDLNNCLFIHSASTDSVKYKVLKHFDQLTISERVTWIEIFKNNLSWKALPFINDIDLLNEIYNDMEFDFDNILTRQWLINELVLNCSIPIIEFFINKVNCQAEFKLRMIVCYQKDKMDYFIGDCDKHTIDCLVNEIL